MTTKSLDFDEEAILRRLDRTSPDTLLKSIVGELTRLARAHNQLRARLAAMEALQTVADRIVAGDVTDLFDSYPRQIEINADNSIIDADGFYHLEHGHDGTPFRWSGPDRQFSFKFFIDRRPSLYFELRFGKIYADVPVDGLVAYADGQPIDLVVQGRPGGHKARGVLPPREKPGGSVLSFTCPKMESPKSRGNADSRVLGVLFHSLQIGGAQASSDRLVSERSKPNAAAPEHDLATVSRARPAPEGVANNAVTATRAEPAPANIHVEVHTEPLKAPDSVVAPSPEDLQANLLPASAKLGQ
jgi:hypothetical protein